MAAGTAANGSARAAAAAAQRRRACCGGRPVRRGSASGGAYARRRSRTCRRARERNARRGCRMTGLPSARAPSPRRAALPGARLVVANGSADSQYDPVILVCLLLFKSFCELHAVACSQYALVQLKFYILLQQRCLEPRALSSVSDIKTASECLETSEHASRDGHSCVQTCCGDTHVMRPPQKSPRGREDGSHRCAERAVH